LSDSNSPVHKCHKGNYKNQSVQCGVPHSGLCVSLTTIRPELGVLRGEWTVYEVSYVEGYAMMTIPEPPLPPAVGVSLASDPLSDPPPPEPEFA